jgi:hypothetical protein
MKRRSKGASPNGGFLYFRPVEFLEQSSYSSLGAKIECGAITIRNDRDGYKVLANMLADLVKRFEDSNGEIKPLKLASSPTDDKKKARL